MQSKEQHYLNKLSEECAEVSQMAIKSLTFGLNSVRPGQKFSNRERLHQELDDLLAVVDVLNREYELNFDPDEKAWVAKKANMAKFLEISRKLGRTK